MKEMSAIFTIFFLIVVAVFIAGPLGWILGKIRRFFWIKSARKLIPTDDPVIVQYEPPIKLSPAEIAYLYDRTFGEQELLASLFDLEQRAKLRLEKVKTRETTNFKVVLLSKGTEKDLSSFDQELILQIKVMPDKDWLSIKRNNSLWENGFERYLERDLRTKGMILLPDDLRRQKTALLTISSLLAFCGTFGSFWLSGESFDTHSEDQFIALGGQINVFGLIVLAIVETGLIYLALRIFTSMFQRGSNTAQGTALLHKLWPEIEGYRQYVKQVELDNVVFENENNQQTTMLTVLPYAIALNLSTRWETRFKN